jgi:hypothetical protein
MHRRLMPVLDALATPLRVFIRDDDAGWDDARLLALIDVTQRAGVALDLAVIPEAVITTLARELNARIDATPHLLAVHQHGCRHHNHEAVGRKCEFGASRSAQQQRADLVHGQSVLREHFGARVQPIFTPPWNRVAPHTPALLAELGWQALSRDRGAKTAQHELTELAVDVDWSRQWREGGPEALAGALVQAAQARASDVQPLGLMLHHAAMARDELVQLQDLLAVLAPHPKLRWRSMRELLPIPSSTPKTACAPTA